MRINGGFKKMEWRDWLDKRIFVQLKRGSIYSGKVIDVDEKDKSVIFITIIDKFNEKVTFVHSEILKIKEENL